MNPITPAIASCLVCSYKSMVAVSESSDATYTQDDTSFTLRSKYEGGVKRIDLKIVRSKPRERWPMTDIRDVSNVHIVKEIPGNSYLLVTFGSAILALKIEEKV